jgi:hypothetical protein
MNSNGVGNMFMLFEPLVSRREVMVSEGRTLQDCARCLGGLADKQYSEARRNVLEMENLNTPSLASLYVAKRRTRSGV